VDALAQRLTRWVADSDVQAHDKALRRVRSGVPPAALAAFLAAARAHPDARYTPVLLDATRYRKVSVRGQALAALACMGPAHAERAIALAAGDHDFTIRRLAWALERLHPSPTSHEVIAALLERDTELAEALATAYGPVTQTEATDADLDAEIVIFDADDDDDDDAERP